MSTEDEVREERLRVFEYQLHRHPTPDELQLLHDTGVLPRPKGPYHGEANPDCFYLIIQIIKDAELRGSKQK